MSGWLKVEKTTPDKPEIAILARKLGVSIGDAFLEWFRVYSWADSMTCPGFVPHVSPADVDKLAHAMPRTSEHLSSKEIGWLVTRSDGIEFVKWDRHNGKSAKARALEAEKKRKQRGKTDEFVPPESRYCPETQGTSSGPDERRRQESLPSKDGWKTVGNASQPPQSSRASKFVRDGKAADLSDLDWSLVVSWAEAAGRKVPPLDVHDRRAWLRFGVMAATACSENWLMDCAASASQSENVKKTRQALFVAALKTKAREQFGYDAKTFQGMVKSIEIPTDVWKSDALGGPT